MAYQIGMAANYKDLLYRLRAFACDDYITVPVAGGGNTGNGIVQNIAVLSGTAAEVWTLTATSPTNFTVVSSVNGAQADATVGTPYTNSYIKFTIVAGSTAFAASDSFTLTIAASTLGSEKWTVKRFIESSELELIMCGPGTGGSDEIYVGIQTYSNAGSDYYNWRLQGFTGYSSEATFANQPGAMNDTTNDYCPRLCLWNQTIPYWLVVDGRHIRMVAKVSTVYEPMYLGFLLPYGTPSQFPYPLAVGGSRSGDTTYQRYSEQDNGHRGFVDPASGSLRILHGSWLRVSNFGSSDSYGDASSSSINVWPYVCSNGSSSWDPRKPTSRWRALQQNLDGSCPLFPLIVNGESPSKNVYGELQGCFAVPGLGLSTEDTLGSDKVVFQNTFRNSVYHFWVFVLE